MQLFVRHAGATELVKLPFDCQAAALRTAMGMDGAGVYFLAGGKPIREKGRNGQRAPTLAEQLSNAQTFQITVRRSNGEFGNWM
eukprot:11555684-Prorocentrum_lima.AAC.1